MRTTHFLLAAAISAAGLLPAASPAMAQTQPSPVTETPCQVLEVAVFPNRVHVRCHADITGGFGGGPVIHYFAMATSNPMAPTFLQLATAAKAANKPLAVTFAYSSPAQNPPGCQPNDCRAATQARIVY